MWEYQFLVVVNYLYNLQIKYDVRLPKKVLIVTLVNTGWNWKPSIEWVKILIASNLNEITIPVALKLSAIHN